ncbi:MAG: hypothetical protein J0H66_14975 [Solirubrobacterales bacterium]|nr:hypothetical protein [Solirubrobacterales bacterium]OJU95105.1 MAG: hypothetical protein BGO23_10495 [Solirubrobacterales bacterium 67-14]
MALLVIVAGVAQLALGPGRSGVTVDEPTQVERTKSWLDGGDYVPNGYERLAGTVGSKYVYGPAFASLAHTANVLTGQEPRGSVSFGNGAAVNRHLASSLLALLTALVAGQAIGLATSSRIVGLWTTAALLAIPIWTGMGFFNPKDTPVAAGYTFLSAALILGARPGRPGWKPDPGDLLVLLLAGAGVYFAVGTRLAMWLPLACSLVVFAALSLQRRGSGGAPMRWPAVVAGVLLGSLCLLVLYPAAFSNPWEFATNTLGDSSDYSWSGLTLTAGQLLTAHPPWWYLPAWAFASIPLLIGAAGLSGLGGLAVKAWETIRRRAWHETPIGVREVAALLVLVQLLLLPLGSMVTGSTMYSGLRQHLYLVPAVAMLAGLGVSYLLGLAGSRRVGPAGSWLLAAALSAALLVPMVEQARLFPFNYVYVNPVAGIGGVNDRWEGDYWFAGLKEASDEVPDGATAWCGKTYANRRFDPAELEPCSNVERPYAIQRQADLPQAAGRRWVILQRRAGGEVPAQCVPAGAVTRTLRGEKLDLAWVVRC